MAKKRAKIYIAVNVHVESIRANCPRCGRVLTDDNCCMVMSVNLGNVRCSQCRIRVSLPNFRPKNVDNNERFETWDD